MKLRSVLLSVVFSGMALTAAAERQVAFEAEAFRQISAASPTKTLVFSPAAFELDCAIVAESLATIPKANVADRMGVVLDFAGTYAPILEAFRSPTNDVKMLSARGFCVSDLKTAQPSFRQELESVYDVEVMRLYPSFGAESWFKAAMEGAMEDFAIPANIARSERFSFYDLETISVAWADPFPTSNTRKIRGAAYLSDVRLAETWETKTLTVLRLPLKGDAFFFAILPKEGRTLADARELFGANEFANLLTVMESVTEPGVSRGPCAIILPRMNLDSRLDLTGAFAAAYVPTKGLVHVAGDQAARELVQRVKFSLAEQGAGEAPLEKKGEKDVVAFGANGKKLVFNRPFIFFVYHEPTRTIPVAGQYFGEEH